MAVTPRQTLTRLLFPLSCRERRLQPASACDQDVAARSRTAVTRPGPSHPEDWADPHQRVFCRERSPLAPHPHPQTRRAKAPEVPAGRSAPLAVRNAPQAYPGALSEWPRFLTTQTEWSKSEPGESSKVGRAGGARWRSVGHEQALWSEGGLGGVAPRRLESCVSTG